MKASARAHPNIALIKYWGKADIAQNLPAVESLSITIAALQTNTSIEFDAGFERDELILDGEPVRTQEPRLIACLDALRALAGERRRARVVAANDFPTGAGLASSASGYAALVTAGAAALGLDPGDPRLHDVARIGSGSAPRSLLGGIVALRRSNGGTRCEQILRENEWPLRVAIAVTTSAAKSVSSRDGMISNRDSSPFFDAWLNTHAGDMRRAEQCVRDRDFAGLGEIAEHNCLKMHAVMLAGLPPLIYWNEATLACIGALRGLQAQGEAVFFTIDAGPQVKAVCLPGSAARVEAALRVVPGVSKVIPGGLGGGAAVTS